MIKKLKITIPVFNEIKSILICGLLNKWGQRQRAAAY